jgi:hypothetical protein
MNPEQQRIAIAEACGKWHSGWPHEYMNQADRLRHIPDYLNDLNAMHEAEKLLVRLQWVSYLRRLQTLCDESVTWPIHATAAQRAEAFLRTIGKWEESK